MKTVRVENPTQYLEGKHVAKNCKSTKNKWYQLGRRKNSHYYEPQQRSDERSTRTKCFRASYCCHLHFLSRCPDLLLISPIYWPNVSTCQTCLPFCYTQGQHRTFTFNFRNSHVVFRYHFWGQNVILYLCNIQTFMCNTNTGVQISPPPFPPTLFWF